MIQSRIRPANSGDIKAIADISKSLVSYNWDEKQIDYEINGNPFCKLFVAVIGTEVVGFLDYWITFDSSTVAEIGVKEKYQRMGIGEALMNEMFKDLRLNEVIFSSLEVRKSNENAINFYKKLGYKVEVVKEHYYDDQEDALYMLKGMVE